MKKLNATVEICPGCQQTVKETGVLVITGDHGGRYHICHTADISTAPIEGTKSAIAIVITKMHLVRLSD